MGSAQPRGERPHAHEVTPKGAEQGREEELITPTEGSPDLAAQALNARLAQSQELTSGLKLWVPFQRWSELKQLRDRVVNYRQADPSYIERQAEFQALLAQRAQWEVSTPELREDQGLEQLRVQAKLIEEAKKASVSRRAQGLNEHITGLDLYLSQLLDQERASLDQIEELIDQQLVSELEGPPSEEVQEVDLKGLSERHERLTQLERLVTAELSEIEAWRAQLSSLTQELEAEETGHDARQAELERLSSLVTELLSQQLARRELEVEIEELSLETLIGLKATKLDEDHQAKELLDERLSSLIKLKGSFDERHRAQLRGLTPPVLPPPPTGEGEDSFQTAARLQYAVETSERFMAFHKRRAEATQGALEAQASYLEELDAVLKARAESFKATLSHDVIEARVRALSEPIFWSQEQLIAYAKLAPTIAQLKELNELREAWQQERAVTIEEGSRWQASLKEDQEAITRHQAELSGEGGLRERLKQELVWLTFLKEIDSYDTPKLLSAYSKDVKRLRGFELQVERLEGSYEHLSYQLNQLVALRSRLSDPLMRQYPSSNRDFRRWASSLYELIEPEGVDEGGELGGDREEQGAEAQPAPLPDEVAKLTDALRARIPPRVNYYQERQQLTAQIHQLIDERAQLLTQLASLFNQRGELARHIWRSATLLKRRHQTAQSSFTLTQEMRTHRSLAWVNTLKAANINSLREEHERETQWLKFEPNYAPIKSSLEEWSVLLSQILDLIEQIEELQRELKREDDLNPAPMSKLEADQKAHALKLRIEQDQLWYESIWDLINSEDTKTLDELLEGLYIQLTKLERKQELIDKSIKQSVLLVERVSAQRPILESFKSSMGEAHKTLERRLSAERMRLMVQLDPQGSLATLSAYNSENEDLKLSTSTGPKLEGEAMEHALLELKRFWTLQQAYHATLSRIKEALDTHGMLERSVGQVKDSIARLQSEHEQLARPLYRLLGSRSRGLVRGERHDQVGEIDRIRDERFQKKLKAGAGIILSFCLIPLIALLLMRFVSHFGERIFVYVLREQTDRAQTERERQEREERSATLFQVFRAASSLVIWTLTGIYLLKAVQVDVTPIIASAGVLGLALAFGAQELVRDFFAGFFILLENQYNIGDIVRIQGTFGKIERITLRLTIIRDEEGVVHFIPNGQVGMVSNCTREWSQARLDIGASYNAPPKQVIDCLRQVGDQLCVDPLHGGYVLACEVLGLERFDDSSVAYRVKLRVTAGQQWNIARIYRQRVMEAFEEWGIEIPFPQMVLHYPALQQRETEEG